MKKVTNLFFALLISSSLFISCNDDDATLCIENIQEDCFCTLQYDPVCGCNEVTYGNACVAECAGITDYTAGTCN